MITDLAGRVIDWNSSAQRMFGHSKAEVLGKTLIAVLRPGEPDQLTPALLATLEVGNRWSGELEVRHGEEKRCLESVVVPLRDGEGRKIAYVAMHRDVTERKQLQGKLLLSDRLASVGTLAAGVAHEINNPLAYVLANLEFMRELLDSAGGGAGGARRAARDPHRDPGGREADRVRSSRDLKTFSRSDAEERPLPVEIHRVARARLQDGAARDPPPVRLYRDLGPVPRVEGVESRLSQVVLNLIINAGQAIAEDAPVRRDARLDPPDGAGLGDDRGAATPARG